MSEPCRLMTVEQIAVLKGYKEQVLKIREIIQEWSIEPSKLDSSYLLDIQEIIFEGAENEK